VQEAYGEHGDAEGEEPAANDAPNAGRRAGFRHGIPPERQSMVPVSCPIIVDGLPFFYGASLDLTEFHSSTGTTTDTEERARP
jgi:hypothetical protein